MLKLPGWMTRTQTLDVFSDATAECGDSAEHDWSPTDEIQNPEQVNCVELFGSQLDHAYDMPSLNNAARFRSI